MNFSTTSKSPKFSCTWWQTCAKHVYEKKKKKKLFYNAPLRHRPMFSAVSLEGIINSKKFKKIQNLGNLALFVQEIMCAKIEVIWRWLKKSPHSGGTIWSNLSQFLNKCDFLTTSKSHKFSCTWWPTCAKHGYQRKFGFFLQCPLEVYTDVWTSQSIGQYKFKKI